MKPVKLLLTIALLVLAAGVALDAARAENKKWPPPVSVTDLSDSTHWPDDPGYAGAWEMFSFIPKAAKGSVRKAELKLGSGIHADRAWQKTTGDARVVIAVLDSGIKWHERDLVNKYFLNKGELPKPHKDCQTSSYDASRPWDANGDGLFNVQDYTTQSGHQQPTTPCDPAIKAHKGGWDTNSNKILDPQDLIQIFADQKDDDSNGYVDDICGWDFFDNDNDANDDTSYGHGTGEARDSAAETNNGMGDAGVCPRCRILPVRVGDSFMTEANDFGLAVIFAVDSGASVVQEALGSISNNQLAMAAIDYAYYANVVIIGSAADENAFHANFPATNQHSTYVHAIVFDGSSASTATTFLNFNNCTNYGPRLELSAPGSGCSSEATGKTSGVAGLMYSAALKANLGFPGGKQAPSDKLGARRISAEEAKQLLTMTVDDIDVPESKTDTTKYPSKPGWEQRFGWGRVNARSVVDAILAKKIPPEVDILAPAWFEVIYPERTAKATIRVQLNFRSDLYQSVDYVLEWAGGADPAAGDWKTLEQKKGLTSNTTIKYEWDLSNVKIDNPAMPAPDRVANRRMVTVRLRATANSKTLGAVKGEARKAFHVNRDADLLPGFPINLVASGEASPKTADLDGDGKREIIVATADGRVHVIDGAGKPVKGWPAKVNVAPGLDSKNATNVRKSLAFTSGKVKVDGHQSNIIAAPAIADLDGDKKLDIVIAAYDGAIYVFNPDGTTKSGFPVSVPFMDNEKVTDRNKKIDDGIFAAPVLADLDGDKKLEIVVAAMDGKIHVWSAAGKVHSGFPVQLQFPGGDSKGNMRLGRIVSSPAVGDVDGDGVPDIVVGTTEDLGNFGPVYVVHGQGNKHQSGKAVHEGWPVKLSSFTVLPMVGEGMPNAPALADVNGDGLPEIGIGGVGTAAYLYRNTGENKIALCFDKEGVEIDLKKTDWLKHVVRCPRKITKKCSEEEKADKKVQCISGAMNNTRFGAKSNSTDKPSVVLVTNGAFGDLNNDRWADFIMPMGGFGAAKAFAVGGKRSDFDHHVAAFSGISGQYLPGFPQIIDDWQFFMNPSIGDIDGDDLPEVVVGSAGYWLHAFNKDGKEPAGWPKLTGQWIIPSPALGDITGDGKLEVVVNTRSGWLYAWKTRGSTKGRIDWESFGHDNRNTRNLATKLNQGIPSSALKPTTDGGIATSDGGGGGGDTEDDEGCSCAVTAGAASPLGLLLLLGLIVELVRRKERSR